MQLVYYGLIAAVISQLILAFGIEWDTALFHIANKYNNRNSKSLPLYSSIVFFVTSAIVLIILIVTNSLPQITTDLMGRIAYCFISGALYAIGLYFYFPLLDQVKPNRIIVYLQGIALVVLGLSIVFNKAYPSIANVVGIAIVASMLFVQYKRVKTAREVKFMNSIDHHTLGRRTTIQIVAMVLIFGVSIWLYGKSSLQDFFWFSFVCEGFGWAGGGLFLFLTNKAVRAGFLDTMSVWFERDKDAEKQRQFVHILKMVLVSEGVFFVSKLISFFALLYGPLMIVTLIMNSLTLVFVFVLNIFAEKKYPKIFKPEDPEDELTPKSKRIFRWSSGALILGLCISVLVL